MLEKSKKNLSSRVMDAVQMIGFSRTLDKHSEQRMKTPTRVSQQGLCCLG